MIYNRKTSFEKREVVKLGKKGKYGITCKLFLYTPLINNGYESWVVFKDTEIFFKEKPNKEKNESTLLFRIENIIKKDPDHNYTACFISMNMELIYQRHYDNTWMLVSQIYWD